MLTNSENRGMFVRRFLKMYFNFYKFFHIKIIQLMDPHEKFFIFVFQWGPQTSFRKRTMLNVDCSLNLRDLFLTPDPRPGSSLGKLYRLCSVGDAAG